MAEKTSNQMNLTDFLKPADVQLDLVVANKPALMKVLAQRAGVATGLDELHILKALQAREDLGSTGIGHGVALPHASLSGLPSPFGLFARLSRPLDFASIDSSLVDLVFLLLLPEQNRQSDLSALSCVARQLRSADVQNALRSAVDTKKLFTVLTGTEL